MVALEHCPQVQVNFIEQLEGLLFALRMRTSNVLSGEKGTQSYCTSDIWDNGKVTHVCALKQNCHQKKCLGVHIRKSEQASIGWIL